MRSVEAAALQLDSRVQGASEWTFDAAVQDLEGRFTFLWGIYQAHSKAEDEIVFPALEKKEATHNISHAYTLDHQQEGEYFTQVEQVFRKLRQETELEAKRTCVSQLRRMCASIRASVETHVRAEENELWPVFVEHFTVEEQQGLVGQIIGRTGAEVLQVYCCGVVWCVCCGDVVWWCCVAMWGDPCVFKTRLYGYKQQTPTYILVRPHTYTAIVHTPKHPYIPITPHRSCSHGSLGHSQQRRRKP